MKQTKRKIRPTRLPVQEGSRFDVSTRTVTLKVERHFCFFCAQMREGTVPFMRADKQVVVRGCPSHKNTRQWRQS